MTYHVEVTDTYGGESNYSWVKRYELDGLGDNPSDYKIVRAAKRAAGWENLRCRTHSYGDGFELRPYKTCMVMFIHWEE